MLLIVGVAKAQIVNIPDANFKAKLLSADPSNTVAYGSSQSGYIKIDANNDGEIQFSEAASVYYLNVSNSNISDLTGIKNFSLYSLNCSNNALTTLDISNKGFYDVYCHDNPLVSFNITGCNHLSTFNLSNTQLTAVDVSNNATINILRLDNNASLLSINAANCTNFHSLYINNVNSLVSVNFSNCVSIETLDVSNNQITSLNVSGCINLTDLNCKNNQLTNLDVSGLPTIFTIDCSYNLLTSLDVSTLDTLSTLNFSNNQISAINLDGLYLYNLECSFNNLTSLHVTSNMSQLRCNNNQISDLNIQYPEILTILEIANNLITSLDLTVFSQNLQKLSCQGNIIQALDFSNVDLYRLSCGPIQNPINVDNQIHLLFFNLRETYQGSINFSNNHALNDVTFYDCNVTSVDLSNSTSLAYFSIYNVPDLEYLNLKTGKTWYGIVSNAYSYPITIFNCPNLQFVCSDESNLNKINQAVDYYPSNNPNAVVSSYCTFTPGGDYNTITGTMTFDADNNGCDASDVLESNIRVNINDGTNTGASFTSSAANYTFYTQTGNFTVTPAVENLTWFTFSPPTATIPFANTNNNVVTQNFCITANGAHSDVEVIVAPIIPARPGFDAVYKLVYKNKGNQTVSGNVTFAYDDSVLDFVSATTIPDAQSSGSLTWNYTNLLPFENRSFYVTLHVNAPTDTPAVNINDILSFTAVVNPIVGDEVPADNTFQYNQTVVGSFDPNDIICLEGDLVPPSEIGNYLHYIINFENTGTSDAENIVVKDIIDSTKYDVSSLQILNSSDPVTAKLTNNIAEFIFQNINLHSGGHGNILLKIKSKSTLVQGNMVSKHANIYFDYNAPIATDMADTTFQSLSNPDFPTDASITVYPNPTKDIINISSQFSIKSIQLYDVQGRLLQTQLINENKVVFDLTTQAKGVYFVKITSDKGIKVEKIVKE